MLSNVRAKHTFTEKFMELSRFLKLIGTSQGKKRDLLGFKNLDKDDNYGKIGKDRFDLAGALAGIPMKSSTLRKGMKVFWSEYRPERKSPTGILELLDQDRISIDKAHRLLLSKEQKKKEIKSSKAARASIVKILNATGKTRYKLYTKSALEMNEVPDNSVDLAIDSHPYFQLRLYRNQDETNHGQEKTVDQYI